MVAQIGENLHLLLDSIQGTEGVRCLRKSWLMPDGEGVVLYDGSEVSMFIKTVSNGLFLHKLFLIFSHKSPPPCYNGGLSCVLIFYKHFLTRGVILMRLDHSGKIQSASLISATESQPEEEDSAAVSR